MEIGMRKYLLIGVAAAAMLGSPAIAKDNSFYVGADVGALWPNSQKIIGAVDFTNPLVDDFAPQSVGHIKYKTGIDADLIGGYDFGMFRLEGELGYKHGKADKINLNGAFFPDLNAAAGGGGFRARHRKNAEKTHSLARKDKRRLRFCGHGRVRGRV